MIGFGPLWAQWSASLEITLGYTDTCFGGTYHAVLEEDCEPVARCTLCREDCRDLFPFSQDKGILFIAMGLDVCQDFDSLFTAIHLREPAGTSW
jgi:hypothetical protein